MSDELTPDDVDAIAERMADALGVPVETVMNMTFAELQRARSKLVAEADQARAAAAEHDR